MVVPSATHKHISAPHKRCSRASHCPRLCCSQHTRMSMHLLSPNALIHVLQAACTYVCLGERGVTGFALTPFWLKSRAQSDFFSLTWPWPSPWPRLRALETYMLYGLMVPNFFLKFPSCLSRLSRTTRSSSSWSSGSTTSSAPRSIYPVFGFATAPVSPAARAPVPGLPWEVLLLQRLAPAPRTSVSFTYDSDLLQDFGPWPSRRE